MDRGDVEDTKAQLAAWLGSSRFADTLVAVDVSKGDESGTTPSLASIYPHERAVVETYPSVMMRAYNTTYDPDSVPKVATHRIGLIFEAIGDTEAIITRTIERLVRTCTELIWNGTLDGYGLAPVHIESEDYLDALREDRAENPLWKAGQVTILATTIRS